MVETHQTVFFCYAHLRGRYPLYMDTTLRWLEHRTLAVSTSFPPLYQGSLSIGSIHHKTENS